MGVVSGLVMAYQFGTNFGVVFHNLPVVSQGPMLTYEVLTAFFLRSGISWHYMLFGWNKSGAKTSLLCNLYGSAWHINFYFLDLVIQ